MICRRSPTGALQHTDTAQSDSATHQLTQRRACGHQATQSWARSRPGGLWHALVPLPILCKAALGQLSYRCPGSSAGSSLMVTTQQPWKRNTLGAQLLGAWARQQWASHDGTLWVRPKLSPGARNTPTRPPTHPLPRVRDCKISRFQYVLISRFAWSRFQGSELISRFQDSRIIRT